MKKALSRMSIMLVLTLLMGIIPLGAHIAHVATIFYVSPTGTDSSTRDGSSTQSWKTLSYAATGVAADAGNTIHLTAGTFVEASRTILPTGVNVIGEGIGTTIIKSAYFYTGDPGIMRRTTSSSRQLQAVRLTAIKRSAVYA